MKIASGLRLRSSFGPILNRVVYNLLLYLYLRIFGNLRHENESTIAICDHMKTPYPSCSFNTIIAGRLRRSQTTKVNPKSGFFGNHSGSLCSFVPTSKLIGSTRRHLSANGPCRRNVIAHAASSLYRQLPAAVRFRGGLGNKRLGHNTMAPPRGMHKEHP